MAHKELAGMSDREKAILTTEELAALEDDEQGAQDEGGEGAVAGAPGGTPDAPVTELVQDDDDDEEDVKSGKTPAPADTDGEPAKPAVSDPTQFLMPEGEARDFEAERKALDGKLEELVKKFDDGELTTAEFAKGQQELNRQLVEIGKAEGKAEIAREFNNAQWERDVRRFLRDHEQYHKSDVLYAALQAALNVVNQREGAEKLDGDQLLNEAHKQVMKEFGVVPPAANPNFKRGAKPAEQEARARQIAPKTLAELPSADDAEVGRGRFSHLDNLTGMDFERAIARMSPDEIAAWEAEQ